MLIPDNRDEFRRFATPGKMPTFGPAPEALLEGIRDLPEEIELHILSCTHDPLPAPQKLAENIFIYSIQVPSWGWRLLYFGCVLAIRKCLRRIHPDIVHGQGTERYCALAASLSGYPNIVTIHGNMRVIAKECRAKWNSFHGWTGRLEAFALRLTNGVICHSVYTKEQVRLDAKQTWDIPNALRKRIFLSDAHKSITEDIPRLINIGSVIPYKRQLEILLWAREVNKSGQPLRVDFIGTVRGEPYAKEFLSAIAEAEADGFARFLGEREGNDLLHEFDTADGLIHLPTVEPFGLVAAEALARNLKLFVSRVGGLIDIATGVEGAELFDPNDWNGLTASVIKWCKAGMPHPQHAASTMRDRYHPTVIAKAHLDLYRSLLST